MTRSTISTSKLTKRYGDKVAVASLDLDLQPGEVFGLLGPNGAGKTTTILMLLGLTEPTAGSVRVMGLDPARRPLEVKRQVGYLPDAVGFYETMTGRQNMRYTARLNRLGEPEPAIERLLATVGLEDAADDQVGTYSRGMRQRLGIADALLKDPAILILDEPTTAIDPEGVAEILDLIRTLADRGMTVLLSSHLLHQVQTICDRVAIFVSGKVVIQGPPSELATADGGPETVEVTFDGDADPRPLLTSHSFVTQAVETRQHGTWEITVDGGSTPNLVAALVARNLSVRAVRSLSGDLDDVYRRYFHKEPAHV